MDIEQEISAIKGRNARVEADKAWELSWTRRIFIAAATYIVAALWLLVISDTYPFLKAFVPTMGYIFSTLSLSFVKKRWMEKRQKK